MLKILRLFESSVNVEIKNIEKTINKLQYVAFDGHFKSLSISFWFTSI